jgi:Tol biopolymer transport system component
VLLLAAIRVAGESPEVPNFTRRLHSNGVAPHKSTTDARVSPDGKFTVLLTSADIGLGTNGKRQVYRVTRDELNGGLSRTLISVHQSTGQRSATDCSRASVSDDGQVVAFETGSPLVGDDTSNGTDVYVRDFRVDPLGVTRRVSIGSAQANNPSWAAFVSGDGATVAFQSTASNLVSGDTNGLIDVFRVNTDGSGGLIRVSLNNADAQSTTAGFTTLTGTTLGRVISRDGTKIVFHGAPSDWDAAACGAGVNCLCACLANQCPCAAGSRRQQVYLRDLAQVPAVTSRVSRNHIIATNGFDPANADCRGASIDEDGTRVAFSSTATNLASDTDATEDIFFIDVISIDVPGDVTDAVPGANNASFSPMLSKDGDEIVFASLATNLVTDTNNRADVFVRDIAGGVVGTIRRYSVTSSGGQATGGDSLNPDVAGEGKVVVYHSGATNLDASDTNAVPDVFETLASGQFQRGDASADGIFDPDVDGLVVQAFLFDSGPSPVCLDAADANDDVLINLSDIARIGQGEPFPAPSPSCGNEPASSGDGFPCAVHACPI